MQLKLVLILSNWHKIEPSLHFVQFVMDVLYIQNMCFMCASVIFSSCWPNHTALVKAGVNPEILKNSTVHVTVMYKCIHFWNGNESENSLNFDIIFHWKCQIFLENGKNHFFGKNNSWTGYKRTILSENCWNCLKLMSKQNTWRGFLSRSFFFFFHNFGRILENFDPKKCQERIFWYFLVSILKNKA